jgi:undecaprenyl diphosphate synthase
MRLLKRFCRQELATMMKNSVRFTTIGAISGLPADVREELKLTSAKTAANTRLTLCLALNYGARDEMTRAVRHVVRDAAAGETQARAITEERFAQYLDTADFPDPDLIIRTAGEMRLSNFLLWQASYAELWFTDTLWPDFRRENLHEAIDAYSRRKRKFGAVGEDA